MILLDKSNILVIVPAYNEEDSIVSVIEEIKQTGFPFVVIDDGSTDETRKRAIEAGAQTISLPFNAGVGGALKCGFKYALVNGFIAIIQCDADGQHPPSHFLKLIEASNSGNADLVIGSRFESDLTSMHLSKTRKAGIWLLVKVLKNRYPVLVNDPSSGFRLIRRPLLDDLAIVMQNQYLGDTFGAVAIAASRGAKIIEVGTPFSEREAGVASANSCIAAMKLGQALFEFALGTSKDRSRVGVQRKAQE